MIDINIYNMKPTIDSILGLNEVEDIKNHVNELIPLYTKFLATTNHDIRLTSTNKVRLIGLLRVILNILYGISMETNISIQKIKLEKLRRLV